MTVVHLVPRDLADAGFWGDVTNVFVPNSYPTTPYSSILACPPWGSASCQYVNNKTKKAIFTAWWGRIQKSASPIKNSRGCLVYEYCRTKVRWGKDQSRSKETSNAQRVLTDATRLSLNLLQLPNCAKRAVLLCDEVSNKLRLPPRPSIHHNNAFLKAYRRENVCRGGLALLHGFLPMPREHSHHDNKFGQGLAL